MTSLLFYIITRIFYQSPLWSNIFAFKFILNLGEVIGRGALYEENKS